MINIKTYYDWHNSDFENDYRDKVKSIALTHGITEEEVKNKPITELGKLYLEGIEALTATAPPVFAIKYKGEELYFSMPIEGTIGEVADIETKLASPKPYQILSVFFRPCEVDKTKKGWVESCGHEVKEIKNFSAEYSSYKVKRYDTKDESLSKYQDPDYWNDFPAPIYNSMLDFIAGIGTSFSLATTTYSTKEQLLDREKLSNLVGHLTILGDGIRSYSTWQKVTFSKSTETAA